MSDPWFARRHPVGSPSNKLVPLTREGWLVTWGFVGAMAFGGLVCFALILLGSVVLGLVLFVVISIAAGIAFVAIAAKKSDPTRTIDDFKRLGTAPKT